MSAQRRGPGRKRSKNSENSEIAKLTEQVNALRESILSLEGVVRLRPTVFVNEVIVNQQINSPGATINSGIMGNVTQTIHLAEKVADSGKGDLAEAMKKLVDAIKETKALPDTQKNNLLDQIDDLAKEALKPAEERRKEGTLKPVLEAITKTCTAITGLDKVWDIFGPAIKTHLGIS